MSPGLADADLVLAVVKPSDHLKARATAHLRTNDVRVPFSVGIELLLVAKKYGFGYTDLIATVVGRFQVERADVLAAAADALDEGYVGTVFDAVHASQAFVDGTRLHTTDAKLLASPLPRTPF